MFRCVKSFVEFCFDFMVVVCDNLSRLFLKFFTRFKAGVLLFLGYKNVAYVGRIEYFRESFGGEGDSVQHGKITYHWIGSNKDAENGLGYSNVLFSQELYNEMQKMKSNKSCYRDSSVQK